MFRVNIGMFDRKGNTKRELVRKTLKYSWAYIKAKLDKFKRTFCPYLNKIFLIHNFLSMLAKIVKPIQIYKWFGYLPLASVDYRNYHVHRHIKKPDSTLTEEMPIDEGGYNHKWKDDEYVNEERYMGYVVEITNGITLSNGMNLDSNGSFIYGASHRFSPFKLKRKERRGTFERNLRIGGPCYPFNRRYELEIIKKKGIIISLSSSMGAGAWAHFIFESIGRLALVEDLIDSVDYIFVPTSAGFNNQFLEILGIPPQKIVSSSAHSIGQIALQSDLIIIPCYQRSPGQLPSVEVVNFLRRRILPSIENLPKRSKRLFVSRANATKRRISNENDLLPVLLEYGFDIVRLEELSVIEQVLAFNSAEVIVSPHGTGLQSIIFCKLGANVKVLEIFSGISKTIVFRTAKRIGVEYHYLTGVGGNLDISKNSADITVDVTEFRRRIKKLCES